MTTEELLARIERLEEALVQVAQEAYRPTDPDTFYSASDYFPEEVRAIDHDNWERRCGR